MACVYRPRGFALVLNGVGLLVLVEGIFVAIFIKGCGAICIALRTGCGSQCGRRSWLNRGYFEVYVPRKRGHCNLLSTINIE